MDVVKPFKCLVDSVGRDSDPLTLTEPTLEFGLKIKLPGKIGHLVHLEGVFVGADEFGASLEKRRRLFVSGPARHAAERMRASTPDWKPYIGDSRECGVGHAASVRGEPSVSLLALWILPADYGDQPKRASFRESRRPPGKGSSTGRAVQSTSETDK
ncbi:hypothetical protein SAMN04487913_11492 [Arthrobacter sp. ok362]|nr:hypothetical protein SAMN04487913_11492 [Arthrobacter sp. ok362]